MQSDSSSAGALQLMQLIHGKKTSTRPLAKTWVSRSKDSQFNWQMATFYILLHVVRVIERRNLLLNEPTLRITANLQMSVTLHTVSTRYSASNSDRIQTKEENCDVTRQRL